MKILNSPAAVRMEFFQRCNATTGIPREGFEKAMMPKSEDLPEEQADRKQFALLRSLTGYEDFVCGSVVPLRLCVYGLFRYCIQRL